MLREAVCFDSKHSRACKELYEGSGGDLVDGSPPAPVGQPGPFGECDNFRSALLRFDRYFTILFEKPDF
eukprot:186645-Pyramimonas_sp.AAC.1